MAEIESLRGADHDRVLAELRARLAAVADGSSAADPLGDAAATSPDDTGAPTSSRSGRRTSTGYSSEGGRSFGDSSDRRSSGGRSSGGRSSGGRESGGSRSSRRGSLTDGSSRRGGSRRSTSSDRAASAIADESADLADEPMSDADAESVARAIVLRQLTAQAKTRTELSRALRRKNVPQEAADTVLDRMEEVGLVDDAGFAQAWVESRQQRRHLSATALRHELRGKGVSQEHVETALADVGADEEYAAALALAERKMTSMRGLDRATVRRRLSGVLGRKGFGTGLIVRVVGEVLDSQDGDVLDAAEPDDGF